MSINEIAIVAAKRTAIGSFNGMLSTSPASKLGETLIKHIIDDTKLPTRDISEVIIGQILTGGCGQNPARQASINAGVPQDVPAWLVNQVCGSGLKSVALGYQAILSGMSQIVIAGGQESMSLAPHTLHMRNGYKMGSAELEDMMIKDGLTDAFNHYHMGITAENIAEQFKITRDQQDEFALQSQAKAEKAQKDGKFNEEIIPIKVTIKRQESEFKNDEYIRTCLSIDELKKLRPAFKKEGGTVTAGNSSGINDGAAMVLLMSLKDARARGLEVLGVIRSFAQAGVEPSVMGTGPIPAAKKALSLAGWTVGDLDLIEANEAFAAQAICVNQQMGWDSSIVNVNGGAIALGHPIGASGTRILVTLLHEMRRRNSKKGLATLCVGGGMGVAMCVERI